jgi:hypothetical protein
MPTGAPSINQNLVNTKEAQSSIFKCIEELEADMSQAGVSQADIHRWMFIGGYSTNRQGVEKVTHILRSIAEVRWEV